MWSSKLKLLLKIQITFPFGNDIAVATIVTMKNLISTRKHSEFKLLWRFLLFLVLKTVLLKMFCVQRCNHLFHFVRYCNFISPWLLSHPKGECLHLSSNFHSDGKSIYFVSQYCSLSFCSIISLFYLIVCMNGSSESFVLPCLTLSWWGGKVGSANTSTFVHKANLIPKGAKKMNCWF